MGLAQRGKVGLAQRGKVGAGSREERWGRQQGGKVGTGTERREGADSRARQQRDEPDSGTLIEELAESKKAASQCLWPQRSRKNSV